MERQIIIGLITSAEYISKITPVWNHLYIHSEAARALSIIAVDYHSKYNKAIGRDIEVAFAEHYKTGRISQELAEEIEEDILPGLSEECVKKGLDVEYLTDQTIKYFKKRQLLIITEQVENVLGNKILSEEERLEKATKLIGDFAPINTVEEETSIELGSAESIKALKKAFEQVSTPVVRFPKELGVFWNHQFVAGAFISLLAPEKRGKTFFLLDMCMRAVRQGKNVAFFQAGDMNEAEQLKRIAVYLTGCSTLEKYCTGHWQPVRDCIKNQTNDCNKKERECDFGVFEDMKEEDIFKIPAKDFFQHVQDNLDYRPCHNCSLYEKDKLGSRWHKKVEASNPIEFDDAKKAIRKYFAKNGNKLRLSTHANGTLSVKDVEDKLKTWKREFNFVPHLIVIDYADLLVPSIKQDFRHQQNQIWKDLRKLSQTEIDGILPCVVSPTQADAKAYTKNTLELDNFSEDKRKFAHVTAMYGLNHDKNGVEKSLGVLRINEIIIREGDYSSTNQVTVLQDLRQGRPIVGSYFSYINQ